MFPIHTIIIYINLSLASLIYHKSIPYTSVSGDGGGGIFSCNDETKAFKTMYERMFVTFLDDINIGIFTAVIMGLALIGDLIVLPALLYIFDNDKSELVDSGVVAT